MGGARSVLNEEVATCVRVFCKLCFEHEALIPVVKVPDERNWRSKLCPTRTDKGFETLVVPARDGLGYGLSARQCTSPTGNGCDIAPANVRTVRKGLTQTPAVSAQASGGLLPGIITSLSADLQGVFVREPCR